MIGFERWMQCGDDLDSTKNKFAATICARGVLSDRRFRWARFRRAVHWLIDLGYKKLIVCHLNHQLRGRSSDADARFVEKLAGKYQVDFEMGAAKVRVLAKKKKMSIETAAREARYSFFAKAAKRHRCHTIFLAHHRDDLVETFLLNLIRGAGLTGLAAMRDLSTRHIGDLDLTIVRPLLS